jgi:predicted  nucleic acid-binding Zn-ribbon protein
MSELTIERTFDLKQARNMINLLEMEITNLFKMVSTQENLIQELRGKVKNNKRDINELDSRIDKIESDSGFETVPTSDNEGK